MHPGIKIVHFQGMKESHFPFARSIRFEVFVKEQGVSADEEFDGSDGGSDHILIYETGNPVATARFRKTTNGIKLERFAVLKTCRNRGFGKQLLQKILEQLPVNETQIYLHAQISVARFYEKYGFARQGKPFKEAGIEHIKMILNPDFQLIDNL